MLKLNNQDDYAQENEENYDQVYDNDQDVYKQHMTES